MATDRITSIETTDAQGGPAAMGTMRLSIVRAEKKQEHNDWLTERLFEETRARHDAEFARDALAMRHETVLTRIGLQDREIAYWQTIGGWLLLAACTGWLAFGLVLLAYVRGV